MTDQITAKLDSLRLLLATTGEPAARLRALDAYSGDLRTPELQAFLCDYQPRDPSSLVRVRILRDLTTLKSEFLAHHPPYREICLRAIASEAEPAIRRMATEALCGLILTHPELARIAVDLARYELDAQVSHTAMSALVNVQDLDESIILDLAETVSEAPADLQLPLLMLLERVGKGPALEKAALSLLSPPFAVATRHQAAMALVRIPILSTNSIALIAKALRHESSPIILELLLEKILGATKIPVELVQELLTSVLARGPTGETALSLFAFKLGSNPVLSENILDVLIGQQRASLKVKLLGLLRTSGLLEIWQVAFDDKSPIVRKWALENADVAIAKHGERFLNLLIESYQRESLPVLRHQVLNLMERHAHLLPLVSPEKTSLLFNETDPLRRRQIARLTLPLPLDRSRSDQRPIVLGWLQLLQDRLLEPKDRQFVIQKLEQLQFAPEPALESALKILLTQIRDFDELKDLFPRLKKLVQDPAFLLPQYLDLLERFIGYYPAEPLVDILRVLRDLKSRSTDLQKRIPHLARITGETWLLAEASEAEQKSTLFPSILGHINNAEWSHAADLLRDGFQNSTLRKSEVLKVYRLALAHPEMNELSQELFPMMIRANLITPEIVDISLHFLAQFARNSSTSYNIAKFLQELGPQVAGFEARYLEFLSADRYRRFAQQNDEPVRDDEVTRDPVEWSDSRNWHISYPSWRLFDNLAPDSRHQWLRREVQAPVNQIHPIQWSTTLFALQNFRNVMDFGVDDLLAVGRAFLQAKGQSELRLVADRAACLFSEKWRNFEMTDEKRQSLPCPIREIATQIFYDQIANWVQVGGLEYSGRVMPMDGIDLNQLRTMWTMGEDHWQKFWKGYIELIGVNGTSIIPPEPNQKKRASAHFHRYGPGDGLSTLMQFLLLTPAPDPKNTEFFTMWVNTIRQASKRVPEVFARSLAQTDTDTKARIAALMSHSIP